MRRIYCSLLIVLLSVLCGCAGQHIVTVEAVTSKSFAHDSTPNNTYFISSRNEDISTSVYYDDYKDIVKNALIKNGFSVVDDIKDADLIARIDFTDGEYKNYFYTNQYPVYGQIGTTLQEHTGYGPNGQFTYTTTTPQYGTIGYNTYQVEDFYYIYRLDVSGLTFNKKDKKLKKALWNINLYTTKNEKSHAAVIAQFQQVLDRYITKDMPGQTEIEFTEKNHMFFIKENK